MNSKISQKDKISKSLKPIIKESKYTAKSSNEKIQKLTSKSKTKNDNKLTKSTFQEKKVSKFIKEQITQFTNKEGKISNKLKNENENIDLDESLDIFPDNNMKNNQGKFSTVKSAQLNIGNSLQESQDLNILPNKSTIKLNNSTNLNDKAQNLSFKIKKRRRSVSEITNHPRKLSLDKGSKRKFKIYSKTLIESKRKHHEDLFYKGEIKESLDKVITNKPEVKEVLEGNRNLKKNLKDIFDSSDEEEFDVKEGNNNKISIVFDIDGYFLETWEKLILIIICYTLIITPMTFAFHIFNHTFNHSVDLCFDFIYISDIIFHCFTPYTDYEDKLITSNKEIVHHYLHTWFITDFISTLHVLENFSHNLLFQTIFKNLSIYLRLLKTLKIIKKYEKIEEVLVELDVSFRKIKFVQYFVTFFIITHNLACTWIFLADLDDQNWIEDSDLESLNSIQLYITSVYYIWSTLLTIGYGDILCKNIFERIFTIILLMFSVFSFGFMISYFSTLFRIQENISQNLINKINLLSELKKKDVLISKGLSNSYFIFEYSIYFNY